MIVNDMNAILLDLDRDNTYMDNLGLTTKKIEEFCSQHALNVSKRAIKENTENRLNPPLMIVAFHYYLKIYQRIPNQKEFEEFYFEVNCDWVNKKINQDNKESFLSRLARFYASAVRELHFLFLIKESEYFDNVIYNVKLDIKQKIDVLAIKKDKKYGFQVMVGTPRSLEFSRKKETSYREYEAADVELHPILLNLSDCKTIKTKKDTFKFYKKTYIDHLVRELEQNINS